MGYAVVLFSMIPHSMGSAVVLFSLIPHSMGCGLQHAGYSIDPSTGVPAIIMRFYRKGSLREHLDKTQGLPHPSPHSATKAAQRHLQATASRLSLAVDVAQGMAYLHG